MKLQVRSKYLGELGVSQWYARKKLLGASPSPVLKWSEESLSVAKPKGLPLVEVIRSDAATRHTPQSDVGNDIAADRRVPDVPVAESAPVLVDTEVPKKTALPTLIGDGSEKRATLVDAVQAIHWRSYRFGSWMFLDISDSEPDVGGFDVPKLVANVVFACRGEVCESDEQQSFNWPVFQRKELASIPGVSGEALLERWLRSILVAPLSCILMHGKEESAGRGILAPLMSKSDAVTACFPHSLSALIARPSLKREYWEFLKKNGLSDVG